MYTVQLLKSARRNLEKLDRTTAKRIVDRLEWLSLNLDPTKLYPLKGELSGLQKLQDGQYRIFYEILLTERIILVYAIGHRREIYRRRQSRNLTVSLTGAKHLKYRLEQFTTFHTGINC